ncbi:MAG: hypothetical protein H0U10_15625 [Chloroflexia bacterium]|nr:hypothetical protein [Chloroflexia bacterium]
MKRDRFDAVERGLTGERSMSRREVMRRVGAGGAAALTARDAAANNLLAAFDFGG